MAGNTCCVYLRCFHNFKSKHCDIDGEAVDCATPWLPAGAAAVSGTYLCVLKYCFKDVSDQVNVLLQ